MTDFDDYDLLDEAEDMLVQAIRLLERAIPTMLSVENEELRTEFVADPAVLLQSASAVIAVAIQQMDYAAGEDVE